MGRVNRKQAVISEFHRRLLNLIEEMESLGHLLFYDVDEGDCRLRIDNQDATIAVLKRHFPDAKLCSLGGGSATYIIPEFDGSIPDGYRGEANVDEAKRFRFIDRAQWVQITENCIFVWLGGDRITMYELNGLGNADMIIQDEPSLSVVQAMITKYLEPKKEPPRVVKMSTREVCPPKLEKD